LLCSLLFASSIKRLSLIYGKINLFSGDTVAQLVEELHYKPEGNGVDSPSCRSYFSSKVFFRSPYGTLVDLGNRNEHQEYFLGLKAAGAEV
jgi:hypothetical protein